MSKQPRQPKTWRLPEPGLTEKELRFLLQLLEAAPLTGRPAELTEALEMIEGIRAWLEAALDER